MKACFGFDTWSYNKRGVNFLELKRKVNFPRFQVKKAKFYFSTQIAVSSFLEFDDKSDLSLARLG